MRQTSVHNDKKAQGQQLPNLFGHTAIRAHPSHAVAAGVDSDLRTLAHDSGHNFTNIPAHAPAPGIPANFATPACLAFPRRCPFGGACHACPVTVQAKLAINQSGDSYEQEADRMAERVLRMPGSSIPATTAPSTKSTPSAVPPIVHEVLRSPGQPLDTVTRAFFEPRFSHDFSQVRVHTDRQAAESARTMNALAYTVGREVVFGAGQYAPHSTKGSSLLAHELTHVVQQNSSATSLHSKLAVSERNDADEQVADRTATRVAGGEASGPISPVAADSGLLQRAETDTSAGCRDLRDTKDDVNTRINQALRNARTTSGASAPSVIRGLYTELATNTSLGRTAIEDWAATLGPSKVRQPAQQATKYAGVSYRLWSQPLFPILNPTMRINDICVGSDKLGHFLQQGAEYFQEARRPGGSAARAEEYGRETEAGGFGLQSTGVYSNADLEANRQGLRLYEDLAAKPVMNFDIASYINPRWNEEINPSHYEASVGRIVWRNRLNGSWRGSFTAPGQPGSQATIANLSVADDNVSLSGQYGYVPGGGNAINGTITHGRIAHQTNALGAITGLQIDFDWQQAGSSGGKGRWTSSSESTLQGVWGTGASRDNGGNWNMDRSRTTLSIPLSPAAIMDRCYRECEAEFDRCTATSRSGGLVCLGRRTTCMQICGLRGQR